MRFIRNKVRNWLGIDALEVRLTAAYSCIGRADEKLKQRMDELDRLTHMDADVGYRSGCTIIISGMYRGRAYVQAYDVGHEEFRHTVERYKGMRKHGFIRNVDYPIGFNGSFEI
jgi:hypothetical protein